MSKFSVNSGASSTAKKDEKKSLLPSVVQGGKIRKKKYKSVILNVCSFILVTEFCERLAYYGLTGSLPIFFIKHLGMDSVLATELNSAFSSLCYLTPLLGAYIADTHLGRFSTIVTFCLLYLLGLGLCVLGSFPSLSSTWIFMFGLFFGVAFGAGGIKPNVVVLGADQFDIKDPAQRQEKDSFFNWFYWSINIGATFSYGVIANLAVNGFPPYIPQEYGFFVSFLIPTVFFMVAFGVFYSGKPRYTQIPPKGSTLSLFFQILFTAGKKSWQGKIVLSGGFAFLPGILFTTWSYFIKETNPLHLLFALAGAFMVLYGTIVLIWMGQSTQWLRFAIKQNGGEFTQAQVKDVSQVMRLSPYLSFIIIFWAVYGQQGTNFMLQGCQMDLRLNKNSAMTTTSSKKKDDPALLSSAFLSILDSSVILIFIPIFDRIIYPLITKCGIQLTLLRKVGGGFFFCFLSMAMAGWIETLRKKTPLIQGVDSNCSQDPLPMNDISIWWQTPQYLLIGISEILTSISSYDLFYSEVPESMRSVCQALNLLTTTLGYIVAGGINSIFSFWIKKNLNDGHLEYIFYVLAALVLLNLVAFVYVSQSFEYHAPSPTTTDAVSGFSPALPRAAHRFLNRIGQWSGKIGRRGRSNTTGEGQPKQHAPARTLN